MKRTGAQIVWESMMREGVAVVFGYPGGAIMPVYDALLDYPVHHVLVRHEENAAFAADGYARASGRVGVCLATSGPGATNLLTGLADAMMDSAPVVAITGPASSVASVASANGPSPTVLAGRMVTSGACAVTFGSSPSVANHASKSRLSLMFAVFMEARRRGVPPLRDREKPHGLAAHHSSLSRRRQPPWGRRTGQSQSPRCRSAFAFPPFGVDRRPQARSLRDHRQGLTMGVAPAGSRLGWARRRSSPRWTSPPPARSAPRIKVTREPRRGDPEEAPSLRQAPGDGRANSPTEPGATRHHETS